MLSPVQEKVRDDTLRSESIVIRAQKCYQNGFKKPQVRLVDQKVCNEKVDESREGWKCMHVVLVDNLCHITTLLLYSLLMQKRPVDTSQNELHN